MTQLYGFAEETRAIATLCDEKERTTLLSLLTKEHFAMPWTHEAFEVLSRHVLSWNELSDTFREQLQEMDEPWVSRGEALGKLVERLEYYRRLRVLRSCTSAAQQALAHENINVEDVVQILREGLARIGVG